jgi:CHAT domain-containing protein
MRTFFYTFIIVLIFEGCQPHSNISQKTIDTSCQRLLDVALSKTTDTLVLRHVWDSTSVLTETFSSRQHDSLFAVISRLLGNRLLLTNGLQARMIYKKGLEIGLRQLSKTDDIITRLYRNIGLTYYNSDDYKMALHYFDSVKIVRQDTATQIMKIQNLMNIAVCYQHLNDNKSGELIMRETEPLAFRFYEKPDLASFLGRYSSCYRTLKAYDKAQNKAQQGLSLMQNLASEKPFLAKDSIILADLYYYMAYALHDSGIYKPAEHYYFEALSIYKKQKNWDGYKRGLGNLGFLYRFEKQFDKAEKILTEGIVLHNSNELSNDDIRTLARFYVNRSEVYLEAKQYQKAISDHDSAIYFFTLYEKKPSLTAIMLQARPVLLSVLSDKAKAYIALAENGSDTEGYQKALKLTQQTIDLTDDIRADYFSDDAKLSLANDIKPALEKAIGVCQKLYQKTHDTTYLNKAFTFVEYSRSMVLFENARLDNQLPPDLKAGNEDLKKREAALIAKNNVEELQNYLRLKRQFREKIKSINHNQLASVATLQKALLLNNATALIEFFVGDSTIFVFTMLQNDLKLASIPKPKDFEKQIETFRQGITLSRPVHDATAFVQQSRQLYAFLLRGCMAEIPSSIKQLTIAPDGVLSYLPFELLVKNDAAPIDFRKVDYLLKQYTISYAYSANLLLEQKRAKKDKPSQLFAGFASKYDNKDTLNTVADISRAVLTRDNAYELKGAKEEVAVISQIMNGKAFSDGAATEGAFKREANRYRILHFAMHSLTNDQEPMLSKLLFTLTPKDTTNDNDLTAAELYTMHLNADLAVLSACNTGYGKISKGEGVMSLARAFTYSGVPATVTSLWKVPDLTTREIMEDFYKNLKQGKAKDAALREAKLTYLKHAPESIAANPFFWAGFVPMGNMEAIDMTEKGPLSMWGIFAGCVLVSGLVFWWKKKS